MKALSRKEDFIRLKKRGRTFSYKWLRVYFLSEDQKGALRMAWSLSKKAIPLAVVRNRLKRQGRERLKKTSLKGFILIKFYAHDKLFYKKLKKKDFNLVFDTLLETMSQKMG